MENYQNEIYVKMDPADKPMNAAVRLILLARGSKKLFSSEDNMREYMDERLNKQPPYKMPASVKTENLLSYRRIGAASCYTFTPRWIACPKHIIYFCGGGFVRETTPQHISFVDALAEEAHAEITMLCYPKAPTYNYADTYEAAAKLYAQLVEKHGRDGVVLMGDSAGATIAIALCGFLKRVGLPMPNKVVALSPVCDLTMSGAELKSCSERDPMLGIDGLKLAVEKWCGMKDVTDPLLDPMTADVSAMPELLIYCGTEELLTPDIRRFSYRVRAQGGRAILRVYKGMYHVFPLYPLKTAEKVRAEIADWLNK